MEKRFNPDTTNPYIHPDATRPPIKGKRPMLDEDTRTMIERTEREIAQTKREIEVALHGLYLEPVRIMDYERLYERQDGEIYRVHYEVGGEAKEAFFKRSDGGALDELPS